MQSESLGAKVLANVHNRDLLTPWSRECRLELLGNALSITDDDCLDGSKEVSVA